MSILKKFVAVLVLFLLSGCATTTPATTAKLPKARASECKTHCKTLGMELGAVVIVLNSTGCVCTPPKAHPVGNALPAVAPAPGQYPPPAAVPAPGQYPPLAAAPAPGQYPPPAAVPAPAPVQPSSDVQSDVTTDAALLGGATAVTATAKTKQEVTPVPTQPQSYFAQ